MLWLLLLVLVLGEWARRRWRWRKLHDLSHKIGTSLKSYPFFGVAPMFFCCTSEDWMRAFEKIGRDSIKHGGYSKIWHFAELFLCVADAEVAEVLMSNCLEKHDLMKLMHFLTGNGSIFAPVSIWRPRRKTVAPCFNMNNLRDYIEVFARKSALVADLLEKQVGKQPFSVWKYISVYSMDTVCETTLGVPMDTQGSQDHVFYDALDNICDIGAKRVCEPWFYGEHMFRIMPCYNSAVQSKKIICDYVLKIIKEKTKLCKLSTESRNKSSFLDFQLTKADQHEVTELELREESVILLIAGSDTSSVGISFTLMNIARYPEVQEKIFNELQEVFGDSDRSVSYKDLAHLKYLEAVIKESLRMYPPVPVITRTVEKDFTLPSGLTLVKGCSILINIWAVQRNPKHWGEDADQFRPERFLEGPLKHPAAFLAFSYGMRGCLGSQYAMMSMKTVLSTILRRYRILPPAKGAKEIRTKYNLMMRDTDNYQIQIEHRNKVNSIYK